MIVSLELSKKYVVYEILSPFHFVINIFFPRLFPICDCRILENKYRDIKEYQKCPIWIVLAFIFVQVIETFDGGQLYSVIRCLIFCLSRNKLKLIFSFALFCNLIERIMNLMFEAEISKKTFFCNSDNYLEFFLKHKLIVCIQTLTLCMPWINKI